MNTTCGRATRGRTDEAGGALILTLLVLLVLSILGAAFVTLTLTGYRGASAQQSFAESLYVADSGLQQIVAAHNDSSQTPRYLFDPSSYQTTGINPMFVDFVLTDPVTGDAVGRSVRRVTNDKDPMLDPPPYRVESAAFLRGGVRRVQADIGPRSLLEYAIWTETDLDLDAGINVEGKIYTAGSLTLTGSPITLVSDVEYVTSIVNQSNGNYYGEVIDLDVAFPSLTQLADLNFYESVGKGAAACGQGVGLYIGTDMGEQNRSLFERSADWYQIDLTLFDFSGPTQATPGPITYDGQPLLSFGGAQPITNFCGVIFVDGKLSIWGILGGRSVEDYTILDDSKPVADLRYPGPHGAGQNMYSNNQLDSGEDGANGGVANTILDPRGLGQSLTIVTRSSSDILVEHNIFMGEDPDGAPVGLALIAGDALYVARDSPKTIVIEAALLARGSDTYSWTPLGDSTSHQANYWAEGPDGKHIFDLDQDGEVESNNGAPKPGDRNEKNMLYSWSLINHGNLVTVGGASSGFWATASHLRNYIYDPRLAQTDPPCYPRLPLFGMVPGTWREVY